MSTYYFLVCDTHKVRIDAVSRTYPNNIGWLGRGDELVPDFIVNHCGCSIRITSEYDDEDISRQYEEL